MAVLAAHDLRCRRHLEEVEQLLLQPDAYEGAALLHD